MPTILKIPKVQLTILLFLISINAMHNVLLFIFSVGFAVFIDLTITYVTTRRLFVPWSAIITGLIIALVIDPASLWYQIATVAAVAIGSKHFIHTAKNHFFNPAAFGLFVGSLLFGHYISWWGVSLPNPALYLLLLASVYVSAYRLRRISSIVAFIVVYVSLSHFVTRTFATLLDPTLLFFSLVMLPEPITSPILPKRQVLYGATVAVGASILSYPPIRDGLLAYRLLPDIFVFALLSGNALFARFR